MEYSSQLRKEYGIDDKVMKFNHDELEPQKRNVEDEKGNQMQIGNCTYPFEGIWDGPRSKWAWAENQNY